MAMKGSANKTIFDNTIVVHPTVAEGFVTVREPVKAAVGLPVVKMSPRCRLDVVWLRRALL